MFEVLMYDGGVYRSDELYEIIEDVGGVVLQKNRSSQMLTVVMSVPEEDRAAVEAVCKDIGGDHKHINIPPAAFCTDILSKLDKINKSEQKNSR